MHRFLLFRTEQESHSPKCWSIQRQQSTKLQSGKPKWKSQTQGKRSDDWNIIQTAIIMFNTQIKTITSLEIMHFNCFNSSIKVSWICSQNDQTFQQINLHFGTVCSLPHLDEKPCHSDKDHAALMKDHVTLMKDHPTLMRDHSTLMRDHPTQTKGHPTLMTGHPTLMMTLPWWETTPS